MRRPPGRRMISAESEWPRGNSRLGWNRLPNRHLLVARIGSRAIALCVLSTQIRAVRAEGQLTSRSRVPIVRRHLPQVVPHCTVLPLQGAFPTTEPTQGTHGRRFCRSTTVIAVIAAFAAFAAVFAR